MITLFRRWFITTAGVVLALTGLAKVFSATGPAQSLDIVDPVFGIPFRQLFLLVGLTELLIAFFCLFTNRCKLSQIAVAWLSSDFFIYRVALVSLGWHRPCACLGNFTDLLHLPPRTIDIAMKIVLGYLLLGSYYVLFWSHNHDKKPSQALTPQETS